MGGSGPICLPNTNHSGQRDGETERLPLQWNHTDSFGVAQHALVLGSRGHVRPIPLCLPNLLSHSGPTQESVKPKSTCLAPRASAVKEQGFSEAVPAQIEAPLTKCCHGNPVNFRAPPIKSVAHFLPYSLHDRKLEPSTIDVYRSAIVDKLGNLPINFSKDENLTCLLENFYRDRPKGRRGIPSWNISLVLHQLTKAPFEPLKEASLKHLTFKMVVLLVFGLWQTQESDHVWLNNNIRQKADWS